MFSDIHDFIEYIFDSVINILDDAIDYVEDSFLLLIFLPPLYVLICLTHVLQALSVIITLMVPIAGILMLRIFVLWICQEFNIDPETIMWMF